jgi:hypothetical protein
MSAGSTLVACVSRLAPSRAFKLHHPGDRSTLDRLIADKRSHLPIMPNVGHGPSNAAPPITMPTVDFYWKKACTDGDASRV